MEISKKCNHPAFTARFIPNKAFKEVVEFAEKNKQLRALDAALNNIKKANEGDILIMHGASQNNVYSNFTMNRKAVYNSPVNSPAESSFNGILELGELGSKFKKLVGGEVKERGISAADIMKNYTTDINV